MAGNIKGITIEIGGNTGPLNKALEGVNKKSRDLQSELKQVDRLLKLDPGNTELIAQKQKLLSDAVQNTGDKLKTLKTAQQQVEQQFKAGNIGEEQYRAFQREIAKTEQELKKYSSSMDDANKKTSLLGEVSKKTGVNLETMKTAAGAVGLAAAGVLKSSVDSATKAEESTQQLVNLIKNQGDSADEAGTKIKEFQKTITDMSSFSGGEARDALQTLTEKGIDVGNSLQWSSTIANVAAGSNKSLSESAGLVADAYHGKAKALVSLGILTKDEVKQLGDSENASISMAEVQKRLNEQFGGAAQTELGTYSGQMKEMQNSINASKTAIGTALLPILAQAAQALAGIITPMAEFVKAHPKFTAAILSIVAVLGILIGGASVITTLTTTFGVLGGAFAAVGGAATALTFPVLAVIAIIGVLAFAAFQVISHWTQLKDFFAGFGTYVKTVFDGVKNSIMSPIQAAADFFGNQIARIKGFFTGLKFELPKIKLPHFTISGKFSLNPPQMPSLGVNWYDSGAIFNSPSIIGVGEKRPEFVGALEDLRLLIREELNNSKAAGGNTNTVNIYNPVPEKSADSVSKSLTRLGYMGVI